MDFALVNKNWTLKLYFFAYNLQLLYGRICFPILFGCQISQCVRRPFPVEKFLYASISSGTFSPCR